MATRGLLNKTLLLVWGCLFLSCDKKQSQDAGAGPDQTPVVVTPSKDTSLTNGVNLQPSYYNSGWVSFAWDLMKQHAKIKTVRIEIEPFVNIDVAKSWISDARSNGFNVIATYHDHTVLGSDDANELTKAANWWKANYSILSQAGAFTINLMNEWGSHNITANAYAAAYNNAISIVRQVYTGWIIIDIPGWGQETLTAANAVKGTGGTAIKDSLVILSCHVYPGGWNQGRNHSLQATDLDDLASANRPCIIGEFGSGTSGSADWAGIVDYAKNKHWAVLAWSWNGDGGSMNMVTPQWSTDPAASTFSLSDYFNVVYNHL